MASFKLLIVHSLRGVRGLVAISLSIIGPIIGASSSQPEKIDVWADVRRELESDRKKEALPEDLERLISAKEADAGTYAAVRISYAIARPDDVEKIDAFWTETLTARRDIRGYQQFLAARQETVGLASADATTGLEDLVWLAGRDDYGANGGASGGGRMS